MDVSFHKKTVCFTVVVVDFIVLRVKFLQSRRTKDLKIQIANFLVRFKPIPIPKTFILPSLNYLPFYFPSFPHPKSPVGIFNISRDLLWDTKPSRREGWRTSPPGFGSQSSVRFRGHLSRPRGTFGQTGPLPTVENLYSRRTRAIQVNSKI